MLDDNNLVTYEMSPEWFAVESARRTMRRMIDAIERQELRAATALFPMSAETDIHITFGEE